MELFINSQRVDFSLDENLCLDEIVEKVTNWALGQNHYVLEYRHYPKKGHEEEPPCRDNLERIEFELGSYNDLVFSHLQELAKYIDEVGVFLAQKIEKGRPLEREEESLYREGVHFISESLSKLSRIFGENPREFERYLSILFESQNLWERLEALAFVKNKVALWQRLHELNLLSAEEKEALLQEFQEKKVQISERCQELATLFTMGKEKEALLGLESFISYLTTILALTLNKGKGNQLLADLASLSAALESKDFVTAADLLDFEIREGIEALSP
ncbi:MAG: hypothetical protein NZM25_01505 [Leptospiraceae bacterium]|nr:hypothetical protein [Leptospiraceae bacterium]MDW8307621.1 hypothetical protein [Leptospiraceae bacterium]